MAPEPETYFLQPTPHVPNSPLPALIYRNVLGNADDVTSAVACGIIEQNHWLQGGAWKAYPTLHFHSVTHECYAVVKGKSRLLLGVGPTEDQEKGLKVDVETGDIIVLPAGVSHCSIDSEGDYFYIGLYPEGSPHWDNNWCKAGEEETQEKAEVASKVPIPEYDPIYGRNGPLVRLWTQAANGS